MTTWDRVAGIKARMWFFTEADIDALVDADLGAMPVLVRMGDERVRTTLGSVAAVEAAATERGSYVRDVSVCTEDLWLWERLLWERLPRTDGRRVEWRRWEVTS